MQLIHTLNHFLTALTALCLFIWLGWYSQHVEQGYTRQQVQAMDKLVAQNTSELTDKQAKQIIYLYGKD